MSDSPVIKFLKIIFICVMSIAVLISIIILCFAIYLAIPTDRNSDYKNEIAAYEEKLTTNNSISSTASNLAPSQKINLSPLCKKQINQVKSIQIDDDLDLISKKDELIDGQCKNEILKTVKNAYQKEINEACNYGTNFTKLFSLIDYLESPNNDINRSYLEVKLACEIGTYVYRYELNQILDNNLRDIDDFSHYFYLKLIEKSEKNPTFGKHITNGLKKSETLEKVIMQTNRFIYISYALKEIHEEGKNINELNFQSSPLRDKLLKVID